jgi:hypothetical protein
MSNLLQSKNTSTCFGPVSRDRPLQHIRYWKCWPTNLEAAGNLNFACSRSTIYASSLNVPTEVDDVAAVVTSMTESVHVKAKDAKIEITEDDVYYEEGKTNTPTPL